VRKKIKLDKVIVGQSESRNVKKVKLLLVKVKVKNVKEV